jgi:hypothetical protein
MFFFPSGCSVDKQVRHGGLILSAGSVKHSMCGRLLDVPVPRNMSSTSEAGVWDEIGGIAMVMAGR